MNESMKITLPPPQAGMSFEIRNTGETDLILVCDASETIVAPSRVRRVVTRQLSLTDEFIYDDLKEDV